MKGKGIPGTYKILLKNINGKSKQMPIITMYKDLAYEKFGMYFTHNMIELSESENESGFYIQILNEAGEEIDKTGVLTVKINKLPSQVEAENSQLITESKLKETIVNYNGPILISYEDLNAFVNYALKNDKFDPEGRFSFSAKDLETARWGKVSYAGFLTEMYKGIDKAIGSRLMLAWKFITNQQISESDKDWVRADIIENYKNEIRNMIKIMDDPNVFNEEAEKIKQGKEVLDRYLALNIDVTDEKKLAQVILDRISTIRYIDGESAKILKDLAKNLEKYQNFSKKYKFDKASKLLDYTLTISSIDNVSNKYIYSFKTVADNVNNVYFKEAVYELLEEYEELRSSKMDALSNQVFTDLSSAGITKVLGMITSKASVVKAVTDAVFDLTIEDQRAALNATLFDGNVLEFAQMAYNNFRMEKYIDGLKIRDAGLVHLLASKQANENYSKFLHILMDRFFTNEQEKDDYQRNANDCDNKALNVDGSINLWVKYARLPELYRKRNYKE